MAISSWTIILIELQPGQPRALGMLVHRLFRVALAYDFDRGFS